jgi:hypothetical protein
VHSDAYMCVCVFVFLVLVFWKVDEMVTVFGLKHKQLPHLFKDKTTPHVK